MKKIALEEHCLVPHLADYWEPTVSTIAAPIADNIRKRLFDFGDQRLEEMDAAGIEISVLSIAGPGVQVEPDTALATRHAQLANDLLAKQVAARPDRYAGFAHLALQDPKAAADELERCVRDLGFKGALIYLHPADPERAYAAIDGQKQLRRATWEWTVETATHALRMVFNGTFERFPGAKLILGHMGETLPYLLWRFDSRAILYREPGDPRPLPSGYIKRNIPITISGVFADAPLTCAIEALGEENVMFAADYPFENAREAGAFMDKAQVSETARAKIAADNARRLLKLA